MAVLLELGGQRAAARRRLAQADRAQRLLERRLGETPRIDRGVALQWLRVQQVAVLDEEQGAHQQRRHLLEALVGALGHAGVQQRRVPAVAHGQAGLVFLAVGREEPVVLQFDQPRRHAGLAGDDIALRRQAFDVARQLVVAQPLVVGPGPGKADGIAGTVFDAEAGALGQVAPQGRLQPGRLQFVQHEQGKPASHGESRADPDKLLEPSHALPREQSTPWVRQ
ncbi:hypothetical protein D9M68_557610 [compost metagenome]